MLLLALLLLSSPVVAGEPAPRLEIGPMVGFVLPGDRPGLQASHFGGGHLAVRAVGRLWIEGHIGLAPTSSMHDRTFTVNLFFVHTALKIELVQPSGLPSVVPFVTVGVGSLYFDPSGTVDGEEALLRWSVDGGGGVMFPVKGRIGVQFITRFSVMTTRVTGFPMAMHQRDARATLYSFVGTAVVIRL